MVEMRKFRASPTCWKICSGLIFLTLIIVYINWESINGSPQERITFQLVNVDGSLQVIPSSYNVTKKLTLNFFSENDSQQFDLRIIAIVYNRATSLLRLLNSLNSAEYDNDKVRLEVWIDRSKNGSVHQKTLNTAKSFVFHHGSYGVFPHLEHVGIYGQWLATWKPMNNSSEIAVILEDDLTVSPFFYKYLKMVHKKYDSYPHVNGFVLQGVSIKHSGHAGFLQAPKSDPVFLYPVVGTWGFSPSKINWMKFLEWFSVANKNKKFQPLVPGNVASSWYQTFLKEGKTQGMWSMWHIYFAWKNHEYSLYPNFENHQGLTTNWKEKGLHYAGDQVTASNPLVTEWKLEYQDLPSHPSVLDIKGSRVSK